MKYRVLWIIKNIEEIIASVAIAVMVVVTSYNVIARYLFMRQSSWADELSVICMAYVAFIGGAAVFKKNQHFGLELLVNKLPASWKLWLRRLINFAYIGLFSILTYYGYNLMATTHKTFSFTRWSYKTIYIAVPLGFLSMTIYAVIYFVQSFANKEKFTERYESKYEEEVDTKEIGEEMES